MAYEWAVHFWYVIDIIARRCTDDSDLRALGKYLPCDSCRRHFINYLDANDHVFPAGPEWTQELKMAVNRRRNVPECHRFRTNNRKSKTRSGFFKNHYQ